MRINVKKLMRKVITSNKTIRKTIRNTYYLLEKYKHYFINYHEINVNSLKASPCLKCRNYDMDTDLLIYTCVDEKYYWAGILFPIYALTTNPNALVEVGITNWNSFKRQYPLLIDYYEKNYSGRIMFSEIPETGIGLGSARFIIQPYFKSKYIYIGDADILILEDILNPHLNHIKCENIDFSNIVRKTGDANNKKLTGLHFIEYKKMFPTVIPDNLIKKGEIFSLCDENLLYILMKNRGYRFPDKNDVFRPIHGYHVSFYNRPPLPSLTTNDSMTDYPSWFEKDKTHKIKEHYIRLYREIRNSKQIKNFYNCIIAENIELRKIIQFADMANEFVLNNYLKNVL